MAKIDLPSHVVRQLFFALRHVGGVRRGPIHHHGHHGQRRSVFERLGPRVRRNSAHGHGHGPFGRLFDSAVRGLRSNTVPRRRWIPVRGRHASPPRDLRLQSQPQSPRLGLDGAGPSNDASPVVEAPAPSVDEVVAEPTPVPTYIPMEPMSLAPSPPRFWCDFCKDFTSIPHTLEYSYSLPTPTPASSTPVATGNSVPPLDPWFLNMRAAPALDAAKIEEEDDGMVSAPGVGNLFNTGCIGDIFNSAARSGVSPYFFLERARPSAPPSARAGPSAPPPVASPPTAPPPPATRAEAAARMREQALPAAPPASAEGSATTPHSIRRLLGRRVVAVDKRPGIRRGTWNPAMLGLPSAEVLGSGFYSPDEGESSST
ncbi:COPII coat assembly protein sec16-like [Miscanthus floridulus]|uniref:COPII coat assembly protein sec16-like n=1 Tax=Miscanthus floridulus TaxID=154761 RepID=UPI003457BEE2